MNLTDEQITRAFFEMILRKNHFEIETDENGVPLAQIFFDNLNEEFTDFLDEIGHLQPSPQQEAFREYWNGGF